MPKCNNNIKHLKYLTMLLLLLSCFRVSDSVRPYRRKPTRLPRPWDSPGKNTGVGCHFLLQCMKVKSESEVAQSCPTLSEPMDCSLPGSSVHGIFQARVPEWVAIAFSDIFIYTFLYKHLILSPCLFNLQAEYIMRNAGLDEYKLESRLPGEIPITSDMQMTPPSWQKVKKN